MITNEIEELEQATARLGACDGARLEELAAAVEERAAAVARATSRPLTAETAVRVAAAIQAGEAVIARLREARSQWREEIEETERARRYAAELGAGIARQRGRVDVAG